MNRERQLVRLLAGMVLGVIFGVGLLKALPELFSVVKELSFTWLLVYLVTAAIGWLLSIATHELGHLLGGLAMGLKAYGFQVGPFAWRRTSAGSKVYFTPLWRKLGGLVAMVPADRERLRRRYFCHDRLRTTGELGHRCTLLRTSSGYRA